MTLPKHTDDDLPGDQNELDDEIPSLDIVNPLDALLYPYRPVTKEIDSDIQFTTAQIIQAIELHYGITQGDDDYRHIDGKLVVDEMIKRGFKMVNTGGLNLQWILKNK